MNNEQLWRIKRTGNQYSGRFEKTKEIKKRRNKTKETERNEAKYLKQWVSKKMRTSIALVEAFNFFFWEKKFSSLQSYLSLNPWAYKIYDNPTIVQRKGGGGGGAGPFLLRCCFSLDNKFNCNDCNVSIFAFLM